MKAASFDDDDDSVDKNSKGNRTLHPELIDALNKKGTSVEKFIAESRLQNLMKNYQPSQLKQLKSDDPLWCKTFKILDPVDVVYPAINGPRSSLGNALMTRIISLNLEYFVTLKTKDRRIAIDSIVRHFETLGTKFLEAPPRNHTGPNKTYRALSLQGIITKVLYLFRIHGFRIRKKRKDSLEKSKSEASDQSFNEDEAPTETSHKNSPKSLSKDKETTTPQRDSMATLDTMTTDKEETIEGEPSSPAHSGDEPVPAEKDLSEAIPVEVSEKEENLSKPISVELSEKEENLSEAISVEVSEKEEKTAVAEQEASDEPAEEESTTMMDMEDNDGTTSDSESFHRDVSAATPSQPVETEENQVVHIPLKETENPTPEVTTIFNEDTNIPEVETEREHIIEEPETEADTKQMNHDGMWHTGPLKQFIENRKDELEKFVTGAQLEALMSRYRPSQLSQLDDDDDFFNERVTNYRSIDIIIPFSDEQHAHLGNALMNHVAALNAECFVSLSPLNQRSAVDAIVTHFESLGTRFLETRINPEQKRVCTCYQPMNFKAVEKAVSRVFRGLEDDFSKYKKSVLSADEDAVKALILLGSTKNEEKEKGAQSKKGGITTSRISLTKSQFLIALDANLRSREQQIKRFVAEADLQSLVKAYNPEQSSLLKRGESIWGTVFHSVRPVDLLYPHHGPRSQLGNALMNDVVSMNTDYFASLTDTSDRQIAIDALVAYFERLGTRFLEALPKIKQDPDTGKARDAWRVMSYQTLFEKLTKSFRSQFSRKKKEMSKAIEEKEVPEKVPAQTSARFVLSDRARAVLYPIELVLNRKGTNLDRFIEGGNLDSLPKRCPKISQGGFPEKRCSPQMTDVLFGGGGSRHPGNVLMEIVFRRNKKFMKGLDPAGTIAAADSLIAYFEEFCGTRFLDRRPCDGRLIQASYGNVLKRLMNGLCRTDGDRELSGALRTQAVEKEHTMKPMNNTGTIRDVEGGEENRRAPVAYHSKSASVLHPHMNVFRGGQKRALTEVDSFYQSTNLHNPKRPVLAPRPVFFRDM